MGARVLRAMAAFSWKKKHDFPNDFMDIDSIHVGAQILIT